MKKLPKQEYTAEFKQLAVKRVKDGQSNGVVAKELGLGDQTLRNWVKAFDTGKLTGSGNLTLNAHSVAYIEVGSNTMVLVNTTNAAEIITSANVAAADIEIVLTGINLRLSSGDFHHD